MERVHIDNLGIPPLAGLCGYEEACGPGYGVERNVDLLRRYNYVETRLNQIAAAHLTSTPEWEVKCALGLHLWLDAEHAAALRRRVGELREPPLHLDRVPDPGLEALMEEAIRAESTVELLVGVYRVVKPELIRALRKHLKEDNPLVDQPTCRILRFNLQEEEEMVAWAEEAIAALTKTPEAEEEAREWEEHLRAFLVAAGGIPGDEPVPEGIEPPPPRSGGEPYEMEVVPRRDARFVDPYNRSAKIDDYYVDESLPYDERVYALVYKRLREMDVPEWMAPIIYKTRGKPWDYYADMSRQLWDETRHAMMGEVALYKEGVPFYAYPVEATSSTTLNTAFSPLEAHLLLWYIEQGLMPRETGKRFEWSIAENRGDPVLAVFQDYDWADEVLHAQIGRRWILPSFPDPGQRRQMIPAMWDRWSELKEELAASSSQENWWHRFLAEVRKSRERALLSATNGANGQQ
jgi:hypothetical protein